jgi:hypothetical protein
MLKLDSSYSGFICPSLFQRHLPDLSPVSGIIALQIAQTMFGTSAFCRSSDP